MTQQKKKHFLFNNSGLKLAERKISAGTVDLIRCWFYGMFSCRSTKEKKEQVNVMVEIFQLFVLYFCTQPFYTLLNIQIISFKFCR